MLIIFSCWAKSHYNFDTFSHYNICPPYSKKHDETFISYQDKSENVIKDIMYTYHFIDNLFQSIVTGNRYIFSEK